MFLRALGFPKVKGGGGGGVWRSRSEQVELQCLNVKTAVLEEPINLSLNLTVCCDWAAQACI